MIYWIRDQIDVLVILYYWECNNDCIEDIRTWHEGQKLNKDKITRMSVDYTGHHNRQMIMFIFSKQCTVPHKCSSVLIKYYDVEQRALYVQL